MPTYIKTGFWEKARKGYKEWLNLDQFIESKIPVPTYKVYTALLTQTGTNAPVAIVLENTLGGNLTFSSDEGLYNTVTSSGLFTENKTFVLLGSGNESGYSPQVSVQDINTITFTVSTSEDAMYNTPIEIRVYN
jgi:hypothetical protein